mmetsp:Transcript_1029/g.3259  ORF Transcript_1029/g.3259 Transcript_1029/m.3259 type:complete len:427 (+) Transcript_1029:330-1610(+)
MYLTRTDRRYSSDVLLPAAAAARSSRSAASSLASVTANLRCSSNHASRVADLASPTGASRPEGEAASTPRGSASHPSAIDAMSRTGKGVAGGRRATASEAGCCLAEGFASPREGVDTPRGALQCRATEAADGARGVRKAHTPEARLFPVPAARSARSLCSLPSSSALKWRRIARTCNKAPLSSSPISMNLISVFLRKPSSSAPPTRSASAAARACSSSCRDRSIRRSASALAARSWAKAARSRSRLACSAACCRRSRAIVSSTPSSRERVTRVARTASRPSPAPAGCRLEWSPALAPSAGAVSAAAVPSLLRTPGPPAATAAADPSLEARSCAWSAPTSFSFPSSSSRALALVSRRSASAFFAAAACSSARASACSARRTAAASRSAAAAASRSAAAAAPAASSAAARFASSIAWRRTASGSAPRS